VSASYLNISLLYCKNKNNPHANSLIYQKELFSKFPAEICALFLNIDFDTLKDIGNI